MERGTRPGVNIVSGSTGWFGEIDRARKAAEKPGVGIVWGSNYSVGVEIFGQIVSQAARLMATQEEYEWDSILVPTRLVLIQARTLSRFVTSHATVNATPVGPFVRPDG
jgi:hypothetical protein